MNGEEKHIAKLNLRINDVMTNVTKELNDSFFRIWSGVQTEVQSEDAITGRASLQQ